MPGDESELRLLIFRELDQSAGNDLLAAEGSDLRCFTKHSRRIIFGHVGDAENLLAVLIVENDQVFIGAEIIFYL